MDLGRADCEAGQTLQGTSMKLGESNTHHRDILAYIRKCVEVYGLPPTRREIANEFHYSSANAAQCHLKSMAEAGLIELTPRVSRGIRLVA